jgi:glycine/D-amino acid oxidase-like deaminating enzyme
MYREALNNEAMQETTWMATAKKRTAYPPLRKNAETDVLIVGGGLAGMLTAYLLRKSGKEVLLLEKGSIGSGATAFTTAFVTQDVDTGFTELQSLFGNEDAKLVWQSHGDAIDALEEIIRREKIDCEFVRIPGKIYANEEKELEGLREEYQALVAAGFDASFHRGKSMNFGRAGYLEIPRQAKFHPLKFLFGLTGKAAKAGVVLFEKTEVAALREENGGVVAKLKNGKTVKAACAVIATYYPLGNPKKTLFKKGMYDSYVLEASIPKNDLQEGIYWDSDNPYHYLRVDAGKSRSRLILGGEDHRSELKIQKQSFAALEDYLEEIAQGRKWNIVRKWNGPILEPSDGLALIGAVKEHEFMASAFSGNGMTYSMISALLLRDLIMGRKNPWTDLYDPARGMSLKKLGRKAADYTGEFIHGALRNTVKHRSK